MPSPATLTGADELEVVFAALHDVVTRCDAIRQEGRRQAAEMRRAADVQLASLRSQAAVTAVQTSTVAVASVKAAGRARQAAELAAAADQAARIRADGAERMTPYIAAAVSRVRNLPRSTTLTVHAGDLS
ncbi:MAG TPA: hypothetical protein VN683_02430 [Acidothermaceae bacterium]|nr:hypothetical protein [Acidothermaceae bacterium]